MPQHSGGEQGIGTGGGGGGGVRRAEGVTVCSLAGIGH